MLDTSEPQPPSKTGFWEQIKQAAHQMRRPDEASVDALSRYLATPEGKVRWTAFIRAPAACPTDLGPDTPGRMVRLPNAVWAYVPQPLPPASLRLGGDTLELLSEAEQAIAELASTADRLAQSHPALLRPLRRRAAVFGAGFRQGSRAPLLMEGSPACRTVEGAEQLAAYVSAQDWGTAQTSSRPMGVALVRELHAKLSPDDDATPGVFRQTQSYIRESPEQTVDCARYVAPPASEVPAAMDALDGFLRHEGQVPVLVKMALVHYQLPTIHPFDDGNGRIVRILMTLMLQHAGLLEEPILASARLLTVRRVYADLLDGVRLYGAWEEWIRYFLASLLSDARDAIGIGDQLLALRDDYRLRSEARGVYRNHMALIDAIFTSPIMCLGDVGALCGLSESEGEAALRALAGLGILVDAAMDERFAKFAPRRAPDPEGACWVASDIADILEHAGL
jgi:Fic family protein